MVIDQSDRYVRFVRYILDRSLTGHVRFVS